MLGASSHRGGEMYPWRDSEPRVEKRTGSVIPEFWALATNLETILLGRCLWTFFLHVRGVLWGKRRVGRKECIVTFFFFFLFGSICIRQSRVQMSLEAFPMEESIVILLSQKIDPTLQSFHSSRIQVSADKNIQMGKSPAPSPFSHQPHR